MCSRTPFARAALCASWIISGFRVIGVDEHGHRPGLGNQFGKQLKALWRQLAGDHAEAGDIAARPGEACDQPVFDRVADGEKNDRDR